MARLLRLRSLAFILFVALCAPPESAAQITEITKDDFLGLTNRTAAIQLFVDEVDPSDADLQAILDATGADQTYDLRPFHFDFSGDGFIGDGTIRHLEFAEAAAENLPGTDDPDLQNAAYAIALKTNMYEEEQGAIYNYNYNDLTDEAELVYGDVSVQDLTDPFGDPIESTTTTVYDPALQMAELPLSYEGTPTTWEDETSYTTVFEGMPLPTESGTETIAGEVQGYGTVITPAGAVEVLRVKRTFNDTEVDYQFITPERGVTVATIEIDEGESEYTVTFATESGPADEVAVGDGETGTLINSNGAEVRFTDGSNTAGDLALFTYDDAPLNRNFGGSAISDDGTNVWPDALWEERYYVIEETDLDAFTAEVCIDTDDVPNVADPEKLVVLTRETVDDDWTPLDTSLDGSSICATVSSFSQFAVGGDADDGNTLPVELAAFDATTDGEAVHLTWQTASETGNAGFEIERAVGGQWQAVDFVEGAGTTAEAQSYRFTDDALPYAADRVEYRLKQVDTDGTAHYSDVVTVVRSAVERISLEAPYPNPARSAATLRLAVPEEVSDAQVTVYNMLGQQVRQVDVAGTGRHELRLDVGALPSGVYVMRLEAGGTTRTERLTIVR